MSRPDSFMPIYWGDYHKDTGHLSAAEHGAYLLLIGHYWTTGKPLPTDDAKLSRIGRMTREEWAASRDILAEFFTVSPAGWWHGRIEAEMERANTKYASRKAASDKALEERRKRAALRDGERDVVPDAQPDANQPQPQPQLSKKDSDAYASAALPPDDPAKWVFEEGKKLLASYGVTSAGGLITKWRKQIRDDIALRGILEEAAEMRRADIAAYVTGCVNRHCGKPDEQADQAQSERRERVIEEALARVRVSMGEGLGVLPDRDADALLPAVPG